MIKPLSHSSSLWVDGLCIGRAGGCPARCRLRQFDLAGIAFALLSWDAAQTEGVRFATHSFSGTLPVKSWKTLRDARIVKQDLEYACGAASLATLLNSFYGQNVTEEALLKAIDKGDGRASFEDMARALPQFGFRAQGFAPSWEQLARLNRLLKNVARMARCKAFGAQRPRHIT